MPQATTETPVYAIYCRLSRKKTKRRNDRESVERQEALCRKYAAEQGIAVSEAHVYTDNNRSAWKPDGERPGWDAMIAAGQRHEFSGLLAYKLDRFSRNVRDAEDLVDLAAKRRVVADGPNSGRIDLSTAHGRRTFREAAVQAAAESDNTSERVKSALGDRASRGLLLGSGRLYGFKVLSQVREDEDDVTPVQQPDEVAVIREAASRMLAGEPLAKIAASFNARGLVTVRKGQWTGGNLGRMLAAPRYGGEVVLGGKKVGTVPGEPVLDPDTYGQVQAMLTRRRRGRRPTGLWPLTGILHCANPACPHPGRTMAGHTSSRKRADGTAPRQYTCALGNGGCGMTVAAAPVEQIVKARVLADLADPALIRDLSREAAALSKAKAAAWAEVERLDGELAALEVRRVSTGMRDHAYEAARSALDKLVADAEAKARQVGKSPAREVPPPPVTEAEYDDMTPAEKRILIDRLRLVITIHPARPGAPRNRFDPRRVTIMPPA